MVADLKGSPLFYYQDFEKGRRGLSPNRALVYYALTTILFVISS